MALGVWPMNGLSYGLFTAEAGPVALVAPSCEDEEMDGCWAGDVRYFVWPRLGRRRSPHGHRPGNRQVGPNRANSRGHGLVTRAISSALPRRTTPAR